jgi:hypothetical protein
MSINNSVVQICSLILNTKSLFERNQRVKDVHRNVGTFPLDRSNDYSKRNYKRIYNDIENCFYTYDDLLAFIVLYYLWEPKLKLNEIKDTSVKDASYIFSNKRYTDDLEIVNNALASFDTSGNIQDYNLLFNTNDIGTSYAYELIIQGVISPIFFINNLAFYEKNRQEDKESNIYRVFIKKIYYIKDIYN